MENIIYQFTQDGSVGLYDKNANDILHSVTGALKESFDKFIFSTDFIDFCGHNNSVSVLDICYGIGYNTKSAILSALKNNSDIKIFISALDVNIHFAFISPFIKDGLNEPDINLFLMSYFLYHFDDFSKYIYDYFQSNKDVISQFFDADLCRVFNTFYVSSCTFNSPDKIFEFLHNIYYQNVSTSMENVSKSININNITFNIIFGDARQTIQSLNNKYNFVFLDGYTPHKQPLLWTYDFLNIVKSKMYSDGIFATYSNSTPVRKSLTDLDFFVGKIILENSQFGTLASFDKSKIKHSLSDYDIGLMNTRAGIPYYDKSLNSSSGDILKNRDLIVKKSSKMSATEYKKRYENAV